MLSSRMVTAIERLDIYTSHAKEREKKEIKNFIFDMTRRNALVNRSITRLENSIGQIDNAVSKSSPDVGLDPQMEPLITSFVSSVDDSYNEVNDYIAQIKAFETTLLSEKIVRILLISTDSVIALVTSHLSNSQADKKDYKSLTRAQKTQKEAYTAFQANKRKRAAKLTNEAYYSVIDIVPTGVSIEDIEAQYDELINQLIATEELLQNSENKKAHIMYDVAMNRAKKVNTCRKEGELTGAQKELTISGHLIVKIVRMLEVENQ